ncbi:RNA polymerase subunit sigma-70 [Corynebacterium sp.]|jgi:RNA polymerase sigma-70 factor (ECF subfamily)|uniref:RNA polymerase subunit sigma-70 n=1 Tax=Corynebacterium sp. TaxID=1720 RepID=UPI0025BB913C|nr:RNA polymerase subunit sigma-70 [Corynebacterium sp.]
MNGKRRQTTPDLCEERLESYRGELVAYCYRFFGCHAEAEDAVQDTLVKAWQARDRFEGRASVRRWLYTIATNVCLDMGRARQRRSLPADLSGPGGVPREPGVLATAGAAVWISPIPSARLADDPAEVTVRRETVQLAFITALQYLPPRQRAILILRDVLAWRSAECADLLGMSVTAVNSALARARTTLRGRLPDTPAEYDVDVLERYVAAFEAFDVEALVALLAEDATFSMPPYTLWLRGKEAIRQWWNGPGQVCRNSRTFPASANGTPAVAVYHAAGPGVWTPFALHVPETRAGRITGLTHFMGPGVSGLFGDLGVPEILSDTDEF